MKNNFVNSQANKSRRDTKQYMNRLTPTPIKKPSKYIHDDVLKKDQLTIVDQPQEQSEGISFKSKLKKLLNHNWSLFFISAIAALSLLLNDIKYVFFTNDEKTIFNALFIFILIMFVFDLIISLLVIEEYKWSFYFWLDVIAALSLLFEIDEVVGEIVNPVDVDVYVEKQNDTARILFFLNVLRIIRLVRIVKIYRNYRQWQFKEDVLNKRKKSKSMISKESKTIRIYFNSS